MSNNPGRESKSGRKKLAILVNQITPYRLPIYLYLARHFETLVLHGGREADRTWEPEIDSSIRTHKVWGFQLISKKATGVANVWDRRFIHLNLGLIWNLPQFRPNFVLSVEMGLRTLIALAYGKLAGVPIWVWWGGTIHSEKNISKGRRILRSLIVRCTRRWISYGATSTEYLESLGVARENILQVQNCVQQEIFLSAPRLSNAWFRNIPHPVILTVGRLIPVKGLDKLIESCGRMADRGFKFSLVIVGQGPERERLIEMARDHRIETFEIVSDQVQPVLNKIYRSADVLVFPTMEDVWGLVVNEAMWAGLPVLCSKYAGCAPELLPESNIFDPLSTQSFDAALAKVFDHSVLLPDHARLKRWEEVGEMIRRSLTDGNPSC